MLSKDYQKSYLNFYILKKMFLHSLKLLNIIKFSPLSKNDCKNTPKPLTKSGKLKTK